MLNQGRGKQRIKLSVKFVWLFASGFYGCGVLPLRSRFPEIQVHGAMQCMLNNLSLEGLMLSYGLTRKKLLKFQRWLKVFSFSNQRYVEVSSATVWKVDFLSEYKFSLFSFQPHAPQFCFFGVIAIFDMISQIRYGSSWDMKKTKIQKMIDCGKIDFFC